MTLSDQTTAHGGGDDRRRPSPATLTAAFSLMLLLSLTIGVRSESENGNRRFEWKRVTAKNFSSEIQLHPHILLFVTVPWSGEFRKLAREISQQLIHEEDAFGSLKLMVVYGNHDQALANSLGATEGINILCYHHAVSFKYKGRRKAQDILASVSYLMSLTPGQLPLETIENSEALEAFTVSTDKSIILLDSCGWTAYLLSQYGNQTSQGGLFSGSFYEETHRTLTTGSLKILKDTGNEKLTCGLGDLFNGMPWLGGVTSENLEVDPMVPSFGPSCSFEEYQKFSSFFSKLSKVARNFFLPPQRQKLGRVFERSLLASHGVEDSGPWSLIIYYAGCPSSKVIKDEKQILDVLEMHGSPFLESVDGDQDVGATLPIDRPSVLLFIDRTSNSSETTKKNREALNAFRDVALKYQLSHEIDGRRRNWPKKSPVQVQQGSRSKVGNPRLSVSPLSQKMKLKDKMSVVIINEGKHVHLGDAGIDSQVGPLQEILTYLLGEKKQVKLSSVAKEAGFQLLSDDIDIEKPDPSPDQQEGLPDLASSQPSMEELSGSVLDVEKDDHLMSSHLIEQNEQSKPVDSEPSCHLNEKLIKEDVVGESPTSPSSDPLLDDHLLVLTKNDVSDKEDADALVEERHDSQGFNGSFFFSDGDYHLLRSLTTESKVPALVIIDPISEQHYVFPEESNFSYFSIYNFLDGFMNGSLMPYQRSAAFESPMEHVHPPFVNLDFHEKDSIPVVTANTFYELVLGYIQSTVRTDNSASKGGVLVLFTNSWCGFCQRMDLVVREVYRAFKGYADMIKQGTEKKKLGVTKRSDYVADNDILQSLPVIYRMDCTSNECSGVLKSVGQRELFPILLLFRAENPSAVPYEGDISVVDIIKFIAAHETSSHHLVDQKGILWTEPEKRAESQIAFEGSPKAPTYEELSEAKEKYYEVLKQNMNRQILLRQNQMRINDDKPTEPNVVVGTFLVATDKLLGSLFDKATILIVGASHITGFQGLIINKPLNWDSVPNLDYTELLKESPISLGGPVMHRELPLLALTRRSVQDHYPQVLPGVYFLDQVTAFLEVKEINAGNRSAADFWFFWGYSGWNWNQLFDEIAEGSWRLHNGGVEELHWP